MVSRSLVFSAIGAVICAHLISGTGAAHSDANRYEAHIEKLRKRLPTGFTILVEDPFVVIGDDSEENVRRVAARTVRWSVDHLKRAYFAKNPAVIIDVWLFKDDESYRRNTRAICGDTPGTPYGYYSPKHRALIMNIGTGGGTLVHEIVHPFMEANFPECPAWFNEGLGSLYEQCDERNGRIWGLTNWRLAGLQRAIRSGKLPSMRGLLELSDAEFYREDLGTNYAQARYLCLYLQEKGLLDRFYRQFVAGRNKDPTGFDTLRSVLGKPDMARFQKEWERFVMGLKFP